MVLVDLAYFTFIFEMEYIIVIESVVIPVIISVFTLYYYECYTVRPAKERGLLLLQLLPAVRGLLLLHLTFILRWSNIF